MTTPVEHAEPRAAPKLHVSHWIGALALLACEILLLRARFKTDVLASSDDWWGPLVRLARFNVPWGLSVLAVTIAIGRTRFAASARLRALEPNRPRQRVIAIGWHALSLVAFYVATSALLEGDPASRFTRGLVLLGWIASGFAVLATLVGIVVPLRAFRSFLVEQRWTFAAGLAAGTVAFACAKYVTTEWPYWERMNQGTLWLADQFLDAFVGDHVFDPHAAILALDGFAVHVTRACSGYEGIGIFTVFYTVFLFIERERLSLRRALILLPLGIAAVWTLNALRIAVLVLIGARISPEKAIEAFHVYAGWPSVIAVALGAILLTTRFRAFGARVERTDEPGTTIVNPTAVHLLPFLASIAAWMLAGALIEHPAAAAPVRVAAMLAAFWWFRGRGPAFDGGWRASAFGIGIAAAAVWVGFRLWTGSAPPSDGIGWHAEASAVALAVWWPLALLEHVVLAPIAEEWAFRGFLARRLMAADFEAVDPRTIHAGSVLASSVVFGVLHENWVAATIAGVLYVFAYRLRGKLFDAIVAHAVTNLLVLVVAATTGRWELWISQ